MEVNYNKLHYHRFFDTYVRTDSLVWPKYTVKLVLG